MSVRSIEHPVPPDSRSVLAGALRAAAATVLFGVVHSVLADQRVKHAVERRIGTRRRNAFYRPAYNAVSVASLAALTLYVLRQPSRVLYHVRGPAGRAMRLGQLASLGVLAAAAWETGPLKFSGMPGVWAWLLRRREVPRPPAGQGPALRADGTVKDDGPFARLRQPANVAMVPMLGLTPRMTSRFAAFCLVTLVYSVVGSVHSDRVLRREYGAAYDAYRKRVPMLWPKP